MNIFITKHLDLHEQKSMNTHTVSSVTCNIDTFLLKGMIIMRSLENGLYFVGMYEFVPRNFEEDQMDSSRKIFNPSKIGG